MHSNAGKILAGIVAGLVLLAVAAGVWAALRPDPTFPAGSPEATVQAYLQKIYDRDYAGALALLDEGTGCVEGDLQNFYGPEGRVVLRESSAAGDRATVRVDIVHSGGGPFGGDGYHEEQAFTLVRDGEGWAISGVPWPAGFCEGGQQ